MRSIRLLSAALLATSGLIAVGVTTEAANAASSLDLKVNYTSVIKLEPISASGKLSTAMERPVKLQYRNRTTDSWQTSKTTESTVNGNFWFTVSTGKTRYFRYYAPAFDGKASIKGNSRKLTVVSQKVVSIEVVRPTQCHFGSGSTEDVTVVARFYPARHGRPVNFASSALTDSDYEDSNGRVSFRFNPGTTDGTYDAAVTANGYGAVPALSTKTVHYSITQCVIF